MAAAPYLDNLKFIFSGVGPEEFRSFRSRVPQNHYRVPDFSAQPGVPAHRYYSSSMLLERAKFVQRYVLKYVEFGNR